MATMDDIVKIGQQFKMLPTTPTTPSATGTPVTATPAGATPAPTTPAASAAPTSTLDDFTYYNNRSLGGIGAEEIGTPRAQAAIAALQKFDPNANFRPTYGGDGQLLGYTLDVDASKLPGITGDGALGGTSGHGSGADYVPRFSTVQNNFHLGNPAAVGNSPVYGKVTDNRNIVQDSSWLDTLGPAAVMLFGLASGGALSPLLSAALKAPQTIGNIASGNGGNPLASLLSLAGGASGIPGGSTIGSVVGNSINTPRGG